MFPMFGGQYNHQCEAVDNSCADWTPKTPCAPLSPTSIKQEHSECSWESQHSGEKVQCNTCSKLYASKKSLKIHNRIHTGYKPYACHICPKRFTQTNVLKAHINYHTGRRDWLCKLCGKAFTQSAHLRTHEKTHSHQKDYECPYCQQNFSCKGVRDRHIRQHTGEKPYQCLLCEKRFTRGESLKFHENAHQGIRPYSCPHEHCRKAFTKQSSLKRHIRSTHTDMSGHRSRAPRRSYHYLGCSTFPANVTSPTAPSDCISVEGSSTGPDSPLTIKIEELDEDNTEDQLLQNIIANLSVAELNRLDQYLGLNHTSFTLDSVFEPPSSDAFVSPCARGPEIPNMPRKTFPVTGQFGTSLWNPADWTMREQKCMERPLLPSLLEDAKSHFQQIAYSSLNGDFGSINSLYSTKF